MKLTTYKIEIISILFVILFSCSNHEIKHDLTLLHNINTQICPKDNWQYLYIFESEKSKICGVKLKKKDTIYSFEYYFNKKTKKYHTDDFIKKYTSKDTLHCIALLNKDTLFAYSCKKEDSLCFQKYIFSSGKYYYMSKRGINMNKNQHLFFQKHKDSLINVKGNNLPPLPNN